MMKKFIFLFIITIIVFSSQGFSMKNSQEKLDMDLEPNKSPSLLKTEKRPLKSTSGSTFYVPQQSGGGYDEDALPNFIKQKRMMNAQDRKSN